MPATARSSGLLTISLPLSPRIWVGSSESGLIRGMRRCRPLTRSRLQPALNTRAGTQRWNLAKAIPYPLLWTPDPALDGAKQQGDRPDCEQRDQEEQPPLGDVHESPAEAGTDEHHQEAGQEYPHAVDDDRHRDRHQHQQPPSRRRSKPEAGGQDRYAEQRGQGSEPAARLGDEELVARDGEDVARKADRHVTPFQERGAEPRGPELERQGQRVDDQLRERYGEDEQEERQPPLAHLPPPPVEPHQPGKRRDSEKGGPPPGVGPSPGPDSGTVCQPDRHRREEQAVPGLGIGPPVAGQQDRRLCEEDHERHQGDRERSESGNLEAEARPGGPGEGRRGHRDPRRKSMTGRVCAMILTSVQKLWRLMYSRSKWIFRRTSSILESYVRLTCACPVMPGRARCRRR